MTVRELVKFSFAISSKSRINVHVQVVVSMISCRNSGSVVEDLVGGKAHESTDCTLYGTKRIFVRVTKLAGKG